MSNKHFTIERIQESISHLQKFHSKWIIVPLVFAVNGVNSREEVNLQAANKPGTDKFLDHYFSGSLIGLPPFNKDSSTLRPRFLEIKVPRDDDYVIHQRQKLWGSLYSRAGYKEMKDSGIITSHKSSIKLNPTFQHIFEENLSHGFHFEELLVWLYAFNGIDSTVNNWNELYRQFQFKWLGDGNTFEQDYISRFHVNNNVTWSEDFFTIQRPSNEEFQQKLIPSALNSSQSVLDAHIEISDFNKIVYGAPGVRKSYSIKDEVGDSKVFVTTFHPEYSYSDFVGNFRPATENDEKNKKIITYLFRPEVFLRAYVESWLSRKENVFLIIEEINRGNSAAIFGDIFQLLDRDEDGYSEYAISCREEIRPFLESSLQTNTSSYSQDISDIYFEKFGSNLTDPYSIMLLPNNLIIRATMNTSDQSLFPMDSAFKRRWSWEYTPIQYATDNRIIQVNNKSFLWTEFLLKINNLIYEIHETEDKCIGSFFVKSNIIKAKEFRSKVIFYLWNDIFRDELPETRLKLFPRKIIDGKESDFSVTFNDFFDTTYGWQYIEKMLLNLGIEAIPDETDRSLSVS